MNPRSSLRYPRQCFNQHPSSRDWPILRPWAVTLPPHCHPAGITAKAFHVRCPDAKVSMERRKSASPQALVLAASRCPVCGCGRHGLRGRPSRGTAGLAFRGLVAARPVWSSLCVVVAGLRAVESATSGEAGERRTRSARARPVGEPRRLSNAWLRLLYRTAACAVCRRSASCHLAARARHSGGASLWEGAPNALPGLRRRGWSPAGKTGSRKRGKLGAGSSPAMRGRAAVTCGGAV